MATFFNILALVLLLTFEVNWRWPEKPGLERWLVVGLDFTVTAIRVTLFTVILYDLCGRPT